MKSILVWMVTPALFLATACTPKLFSTKISVECTVEAPSTTDEKKNIDSAFEEVPPIQQGHFPDAEPKKEKTSRAILVNPEQENSHVASETRVRAINQDTDVWCWAASAQTIMASHRRNIPQCEMVNAVYNIVYVGEQKAADKKSFCCSAPYYITCQQNGWPHQVFNEFEWEWNYVRGPLWQQNVKKQIDGDGPFIFVLRYPGGGGHSFVVKDYHVIDGELFVVAYDHSYTQDRSAGKKKPKKFFLLRYEEFANGVYLGKAYEHFVDYVLMNPDREK
jgi:hypothetical protein